MSSKAAPISKTYFRDAAEAAPSPLRSEIPKPNVQATKPAAKVKPAPANDETEPSVSLTFKVPVSFKWELKEYATKLRKSQHDVMMEALAMHRAKHDKK